MYHTECHSPVVFASVAKFTRILKILVVEATLFVIRPTFTYEDVSLGHVRRGRLRSFATEGILIGKIRVCSCERDVVDVPAR